MKISIKDSFLGTHNWEKCPHEEVSFLRNEHHHNFHIEIQCDVEHNDRAIEFIMLRIWLIKFMKRSYTRQNEIYRFGSRSCEMLSAEITQALNSHYGEDFNWKVSVSEDNVYKGGNW